MAENRFLATKRGNIQTIQIVSDGFCGRTGGLSTDTTVPEHEQGGTSERNDLEQVGPLAFGREQQCVFFIVETI